MKNKNYLSVDIGNMYLYSGDTPYEVDCKMDPLELANGEKVKLFFEYVVPEKRRMPSTLKEFVTRRTYSVCMGFRSVPGCIRDDKTGTAFFERESYPEFIFNNGIREDALFYFDNLKSNGVYKEYVEKVNEFYKMALSHKNEMQEENESSISM